MSVFLDANILFSAARKNSHTHRFLIWLLEKEKLLTSFYALQEAERNILLKYPDNAETFSVLIQTIKIAPEKALTLEANLPDKDKPILGAAIGAKCDYLLTGDKRDIGHLFGKTIGGVMVVNPPACAEIMLNKHG